MCKLPQSPTAVGKEATQLAASLANCIMKPTYIKQHTTIARASEGEDFSSPKFIIHTTCSPQYLLLYNHPHTTTFTQPPPHNHPHTTTSTQPPPHNHPHATTSTQPPYTTPTLVQPPPQTTPHINYVCTPQCVSLSPTQQHTPAYPTLMQCLPT